MTIYTERPVQRRARKAWDYFVAARPRSELRQIWKNSNCWGTPSPVGNAWGWWMGEYWDGHVEHALPSAF